MPTVVTCPHCASTATLPLPGLGERVGLVFGKGRAPVSFENAELWEKFRAGDLQALCKRCGKKFRFKAEATLAALPLKNGRPAVERLKELEQLRAEGLINDEEYKAKRTQILGEI